MNAKTLVLNLDYTPLSVCTVKRAFLLVFLNKAELLKASEGQTINTVDDSYPMPSVIKLDRYVNVPYKGVVLTKENVFKRDGFQCQYCGSQKDLTLDHLVPKAKGGKSTWNNLVTACKKCNSIKGDYTPEQVGFKLTYQPYKPSYIMYLKELSARMYDEWQPFLEAKKTKVA